jgi:phosphoribosylformylglycinamidine (FGAM) synthase PurS component
MQIKKSELRKVIQERLQMFFSDSKPFATVGRAPSLKAGIEDPNGEEIEVDQDALDDAIAETVKSLEKGASLRMRAEAQGVTNTRDATLKKAIKKMITEISGVDSLKPNDPHTPEDEAEKDAADDVMEADPKAKKGRPRGAPHIENVRFWDLPESSLKYIIADASDAVKRLPMARKASKWADEVNDAVTVLHWRKKKGITVDEGKDEKKKDKIRRRPWVDGLDPDGGIGEGMEIGSLASNPKSKMLVKKMYDMVSKKLRLKSIEDVQPIKDGIGFIFGDPKDAKKMAAYLKKVGSLGKVMKLAGGGGNRTLVSLKT